MPSSRDPTPPTPNSYWVIPGQLLAGEYPGAIDPRRAAAHLERLITVGIDQFIDLTEPAELVPYADIAQSVAASLGADIALERHPIPDLSVPRSSEDMANVLDAIDTAMAEGRTVYVHCWGGVGRTGTVVGCWLVRHGLTGDQALSQIAEWWKGVGKSHRAPRSPETPEQREYVRTWHESDKGAY